MKKIIKSNWQFKFIKLFLIFIISIFFIQNHGSIVFGYDSVESLAKCLAREKFTMYGTKTCSSCNAQRDFFKDNFQFVPYVDCSVNQDICLQKNITGFPTWEDKNGKRYSGYIALEVLADLSGCSTTKPVQEVPLLTQDRIIASFVAGLLSFLAPCLLPLIPTFFSVITGFTFAQLYGLEFSKIRPRVFFSTLFFICGFTLVYTMLGATGSIVGQIMRGYLPYLLRLSGIVLIGLGLLQTGVIKINALEFDFAWKVQHKLAKLGYLTSFVAGFAAALSWIPCVGPLLSPILLLAAQSPTALQGAILLLIYSLGLTTPFLFSSLFFPVVYKFLQDRRVFLHRLSQFAGFILIFFGIILLLGIYQLVMLKTYELLPGIKNLINQYI